MGSTVFVGLESEFLVGSLGEATKTIGISEAFVGLILIPVIGNAAEHASAVVLAAKNKIDVALEIAAYVIMGISFYFLHFLPKVVG